MLENYRTCLFFTTLAHQGSKLQLKSTANSVNARTWLVDVLQDSTLTSACLRESVCGVSVKSYHTLILSDDWTGSCVCLCVFLNIWLSRLLHSCLHIGMLKEVRNLHSATFWRWSMRQLQAPICRTPTGEQRGWAGRLKIVTISNLKEFKELSMRRTKIWSEKQKKKENILTWE